jgi:hypothetical protein
MSWTARNGYVINANGDDWLYRYRPQWECADDCIGEPTHFEPKKLQHRKLSNLLQARFAVWAYTMAKSARAKWNAHTNDFVSAMQCADLHGRVLAAVLRSEIGPGPAIIFVDQFPELRGGPVCWRVADDGKLLPYWHRPCAGYVIGNKDYAWAWQYEPAKESMLGTSVGVGPTWTGEQPISSDLVLALCSWREQWSAVKFKAPAARQEFDLAAHNKQGLDLGQRLKQSVGAAYRVFYMRVVDEPDHGHSGDAMELRIDSAPRPYVHSPYWSDGEATRANA